MLISIQRQFTWTCTCMFTIIITSTQSPAWLLQVLKFQWKPRKLLIAYVIHHPKHSYVTNKTRPFRSTSNVLKIVLNPSYTIKYFDCCSAELLCISWVVHGPLFWDPALRAALYTNTALEYAGEYSTGKVVTFVALRARPRGEGAKVTAQLPRRGNEDKGRATGHCCKQHSQDRDQAHECW